MAIHAGAVAGAQDRSCFPCVDSPVDGPAHRGWQRNQGDFAALADDAKYPVAMFLAKVGDVGVGGFEDPQPQQAEHGDQREVEDVARLARRG